MVWQVVNLPTAASGTDIQCVYEEDTRSFRLQTGEGWRIADLTATTPQGLASEIASLVRIVRDQGFEQGRAHVRAALGVCSK